jgi:hypothetical protein
MIEVQQTMNIREHPEVRAFKDAAERYCTLLKSAPPNPVKWVAEVLAALSALYAAGNALPEFELSDSAPDIPDSLDVTVEEWRLVFGRVQKALGKQDAYWTCFDPSEPLDSDPKPMINSLADDLADIYRDVMPGLKAWATMDDRYLETIVFDWKCPNFGSHWGVHAVSAMRALHPVVYLRGLHS